MPWPAAEPPRWIGDPVLTIAATHALDPRAIVLELREGGPQVVEGRNDGPVRSAYAVRHDGVDQVLLADAALHRAIASTGTTAGGRVAILRSGIGAATRWVAWRVDADGRAVGRSPAERGMLLVGEEGEGILLTAVCEGCRHDLIRHLEDVVPRRDGSRSPVGWCAAPGMGCWRCGAAGKQLVAWVRATTTDGIVYRMVRSGLLLDRRLGSGW